MKPHPDPKLTLEKLGSLYGGWFVPVDRISKDSICYCAGAGEDLSFDCELATRRGCRVWILDPTPRARAHYDELVTQISRGRPMKINRGQENYSIGAESLELLRYENVGLWSHAKSMRFYAPKDSQHVSHSILNLQRTAEYFEAPCVTLKDLMAKNHHTHLDLLKIDIEGAEYEVLGSLIRDEIRPAILCVEFDEGTHPIDFESLGRIAGAIRRLKKLGYRLVHRDQWNFTFVSVTG